MMMMKEIEKKEQYKMKERERENKRIVPSFVTASLLFHKSIDTYEPLSLERTKKTDQLRL